MNFCRGVVRNASIYDGTGAPPRNGDIVIAGGSIESLQAPGRARGETLIDAAGLAVCPGFIDIHGHSDMAVTHPSAPDLLAPFLLQGVTTQVVGNCGIGVAPVEDAYRRPLEAFMALVLPPRSQWRWRSFDEYLRTVERCRLPFNVAALAAHGALRCAVCGAEAGPAKPAALERMQALLGEALEAGAFGLSAGLIYPPGMWADTDELVALARLTGAVGGVFACHVRGSSELAIDSVQELLEIGRRARVRLQHSHHEAFGPGFWHLGRETLALEERARADGIDVASDVVPYHAVNTTLLAIYPPWALAGGVDALCDRLEDDAQRARIEGAIADTVPTWPPWNGGWAHNLVSAGGWDNIVLLQADSPAHERWLGRSLAEIAAGENRRPFDCAAEVTRTAHGNVMARYHSISGAPGEDGVLRDLVAHPAHAIGIDVILKGEGVSHPGGHGAFPRVLGTLVREHRWIELSEAIRKLTSLPAARIGLHDRGRIAPGFAADLVVLDPARVGERGTWSHPNRPPAGVRAVFVNGRRAVSAGQVVDGSCGKVLRRRP